MSDLVVNVRQIANYPALSQSDGSEILLLQQAGLGGPYASISAHDFVATALQYYSLSVGIGSPPPADAQAGNVFANPFVLPGNASLLWNAYDAMGAKYLNAGIGGQLAFGNYGFLFNVAPTGSPDTAVQAWQTLFSITPAGAASLPFGTLAVARDPAAGNEVATANWVANNTVRSFNQRIGQVTLNQADIYQALCLNSPIASESYVANAITCALQDMLYTCPFVNTWNGRKGSVYLMLSDISCVFFQPGQQPISPTPPLTSNDNSIATTAWVTEYLANEFAGSGTTLATQQWVLQNTVNTFNGRNGQVTLSQTDVLDVGAAPINSPNFSGIPTAPTQPVGNVSGAVATTAYVWSVFEASTAGVSSFNSRTGNVTLMAADVSGAGGLTNPSAALTGNPTAPTQAPGTNLPTIATCEFVQAALSAGAVTSFNTRVGAVTLQLSDITGVGGAPLVSPNFSSVPTAPTAAPGTNTVQIATTAFVTQAVSVAGGVSSFNGRTGAVDLIPNDISGAGGLVNPSVVLTGTPTAPTAVMGTNTQQIATTAFVETAISSGSVLSFNTRQGAVVLTAADITGAGGAVLASPAFTGAPTAPTAAPATNNTQLATTAFVANAIANNTATVTSFNTRTGAVVLTTADITSAGGAPIASPSFTGTPLGPTATAGTNTTQLATTQFVQTAIASAGVASFNGRTGAVTLIANDVSGAGGALIASPTFTGVPAGPTATAGTNTTQLATTAFVTNAVGAYLPLSGGTLSGALTVNGNFTVGNFNTTLNGNLFGTAASFSSGVILGTGGSGDLHSPNNNYLGNCTVSGTTNLNGNVYVNMTGTIAVVNFYTAGQTTALGYVGGVGSNEIRVSNSPSGTYTTLDGSGNFLYAGGSGYAAKIGGGAWGSLSSDARIKQVLGVYTPGLDEVLQLRPVRYRFRGNDAGPDSPSPHAHVAEAGTVFTGFIAQEVEAVFPEMVNRTPGWIDGYQVSDLRTLDTGDLIYALVNAVLTLHARLAVLEATGA